MNVFAVGKKEILHILCVCLWFEKFIEHKILVLTFSTDLVTNVSHYKEK